MVGGWGWGWGWGVRIFSGKTHSPNYNVKNVQEQVTRICMLILGLLNVLFTDMSETSRLQVCQGKQRRCFQENEGSHGDNYISCTR